MYCGKPGHIATNCNLGKRPGTLLRQMDSTPEDNMDKIVASGTRAPQSQLQTRNFSTT